MKINNINKYSLLTLGLACAANSLPAVAKVTTKTIDNPVQAASISDAFKNSKAEFKFRLRAEGVDDSAPRDGAALTLKSNAAFKTANFQGFSGMLEFNDTTPITDRKFNSGNNTTPNKATRSVIADPRGATLVQGFVDYNGLKDTKIILGRQKISLDDERFFGPNEFRQTPVSFDALTVINESILNTTIFYSYITQVNTNYANNAKAANRVLGHHTNLIDLTYSGYKAADLTAFLYFIEDSDVVTNSNNTFGIRAHGLQNVNDVSFEYSATYALQYDGNENTNNYHADYLDLQLAADFTPFKGKLGFSVLEGDKSLSGQNFIAPFGTLHKFHGATDSFLTIPSAGLEDFMAGIGGMLAGLNFDLTFHNFRADAGSTRYGFEWDFELKKVLSKNFSVGFDYANFNASDEGGMVSAKKWWLTIKANFA